MNQAIHEIMINDTTKVAAYYDQDSFALDDLLGIDGESGVFMLPKRGFYGALDYWTTKENSYGKLTAELLDLCGAVEGFKNYDELTEALLLHTKRANYVSKNYSFSGYSQGEYMEAIIYGQGDYINGMATTVDAWIKGDIFTVALETLETYESKVSGKIINQWEATESIGGVILDNGTEAELIAIAKTFLGA